MIAMRWSRSHRSLALGTSIQRCSSSTPNGPRIVSSTSASSSAPVVRQLLFSPHVHDATSDVPMNTGGGNGREFRRNV